MEKSDLRNFYLSKRNALSEIEISSSSLEIVSKFFDLVRLDHIGFLHVFLSIKKFNEIDTKPIIDRLRLEFPQVVTVVPRVNFDSDELEHLKMTSETELLENDWGIPEPAGSDFVEIEKIDLVLVPLLAFDLRGFRVGYGKGFYDKFLSLCRPDCLKIGLSFFPPIDEISDVNEFDVKLDHCITPEKIWTF